VVPGYEPLPGGTFQGPGPLLYDYVTNRTTVTITSGQTVSGSYRFDADLFSLRIGPYLEFPLSEKFAFSLSGGLSLVGVHSRFGFDETVSINGTEVVRHSNLGASHGDLLVGGYAGGRLTYFASDSVSFFAGAQWQGAGRYTHQVVAQEAPNDPPKEAQLDFGGTVYFVAGIGFSF